VPPPLKIYHAAAAKNACRRAAATADILFGAPPKALPSFAFFDFVFYVHCSTAVSSQQVAILRFLHSRSHVL
jgi:hypothetical protein